MRAPLTSTSPAIARPPSAIGRSVPPRSRIAISVVSRGRQLLERASAPSRPERRALRERLAGVASSERESWPPGDATLRVRQLAQRGRERTRAEDDVLGCRRLLRAVRATTDARYEDHRRVRRD